MLVVTIAIPFVSIFIAMACYLESLKVVPFMQLLCRPVLMIRNITLGKFSENIHFRIKAGKSGSKRHFFFISSFLAQTKKWPAADDGLGVHAGSANVVGCSIGPALTY